MSSSGLSRRRVNPSISSSSNDLSSDSNGHASASTPASHAGSAFAGGSKVAYDPRDLQQDDEDARTGGKMPKLTIMEEVLLLGIKDRQVGVLSHPLFDPRSLRIPNPLLSSSTSTCLLPYHHACITRYRLRADTLQMATSPFGMTTSHMPSVAASLSSLLFADESRYTKTRIAAVCPFPSALSKSSTSARRARPSLTRRLR